MTPKLCTFCGNKLRTNTNFCTACGKKVTEDSAFEICEHCGERAVDTKRNICMSCGSFHNPIIKYFTEKFMGDSYVAMEVKKPSFMIDQNSKFMEGLKLLEEMKLQEAFQYFDKNVGLNPNSVELLNNLGVTFMGLKNRRDALKCYEKALELNPNYYIGWYNKGGVLFRCGQFKEAISCFNKALEINPKCSEAHLDKTIAMEELGDISHIGFFNELEYARAMMNESSALVDLGNGRDALLGSTNLILKNKRELDELYRKGRECMKSKKFLEALNYFNRALEINPMDSGMWLDKGSVLISLKRDNEALDCFDESIRLNPDSELAWTKKGVWFLDVSKDKESIPYFNEALRINPFNTYAKKGLEMAQNLNNWAYDDLIIKYNKLYKEGKVEEASKVLDQVLKINPKDSGLWATKAGINITLEKYEEALDCINKALKINPKNFSAWVNKGAYYSKLNKFDEALDSLNKALDINPKHYSAWFNKGVIKKKMKKYLEAAMCFEEALKIKPGDKASADLRNQALFESNKDNSNVEELEESLHNHPQKAVEWFFKGSEKLNVNKLEEALNNFNKALEIDSTFVEAFYGKSTVYYQQQNFKEAIKNFDEIIKLKPGIAALMLDLWINKGVCHKKLGEYDEAIKCYEEALKINPKIGDTWTNLGNVLIELERYQEALDVFEKAIQLGSDQFAHSYLAKNNKGSALLYLGKCNEALEIFNEVLEINPAFVPSLYGKGKALKDLNSPLEAIENFNKAIELDPNYAMAWYNKAIVLYDIGQFKDALYCYSELYSMDPGYFTEEDYVRFNKLKKMLSDK